MFQSSRGNPPIFVWTWIWVTITLKLYLPSFSLGCNQNLSLVVNHQESWNTSNLVSLDLSKNEIHLINDLSLLGLPAYNISTWMGLISMVKFNGFINWPCFLHLTIKLLLGWDPTIYRGSPSPPLPRRRKNRDLASPSISSVKL